jgi:asparagine synthase (glutamine-hydrolysing)
MCGIAGIINQGKDVLNIDRIISSMLESIKHRGPDHQGYWSDNEKKVAIGNRRLSIQDLSDKGNQPYFSPSKNYVVVLNGEIYNHINLRKEIKKDKNFNNWVGTSDTETLAVLLDFYGLEASLKMIEGMYAIGIFYKLENKIFLIRDKAGEKPLYYSLQNNIFLFGSELKALISSNVYEKKLNKKIIQNFLKLKNIPSPFSIFENTWKLEPGKYLILDVNSLNFKIKKYWSINDVIHKSSHQKKEINENLIDKAEELLVGSIKKQLISDRPIGCFLSGGVDSSVITALASKISNNRIKTFTIGFSDPRFNEAKIAKEIAKKLNTEHFEYYFKENELLGNIDKIPKIYDEPFSDSSQLPTILLSQKAKKEVTVALSGDGGDELFGGYNRYHFINKYWPLIKILPYSIRRKISNFLIYSNKRILNLFIKRIELILSKNKKTPLNIQNLIIKSINSFGAKDEKQLFENLVSDNFEESILLDNEQEDFDLYKENKDLNLNNLQNFMYNDFINYFPNDIMTKVDRASMSVSLESRTPFMDKSCA